MVSSSLSISLNLLFISFMFFSHSSISILAFSSFSSKTFGVSSIILLRHLLFWALISLYSELSLTSSFKSSISSLSNLIILSVFSIFLKREFHLSSNTSIEILFFLNIFLSNFIFFFADLLFDFLKALNMQIYPAFYKSKFFLTGIH